MYKNKNESYCYIYTKVATYQTFSLHCPLLKKWYLKYYRVFFLFFGCIFILGLGVHMYFYMCNKRKIDEESLK